MVAAYDEQRKERYQNVEIDVFVGLWFPLFLNDSINRHVDAAEQLCTVFC